MKKTFILAQLAVALLAGCTQEDLSVPETDTPNNLTTFTVTLPSPSRVNYDDTQLKLTWEEGDEIVGGFDDPDQEGWNYIYTNFKLISGAGTATGTFEGEVKNTTYDLEVEQNIKYGSQVQNSNGNTDHLQQLLYCLNVNAESLRSGNFKFSTDAAYLRLDIASIPAELGTVKKIVLMVNEGTAMAGRHMLLLNDGIQPGTPYTAFMNINANNMSLTPQGEFELYFIGEKKTQKVSATSEGLSYKTGNRYHIGISATPAEQALSNWQDVAVDEAMTKLVVKTINNAKPAEITGYTLEQQGTDWIYRDVINITAIPDDMFFMNKEITEVKLPESVIKIGDQAFVGMENLTKINIPNATKCIGNSGMEGCINLTTLDMDADNSQLEILGDMAFSGDTKLTNFIVPKHVNTIRSSCFFRTGITELVIPAHVTYVGPNLVTGANNLKTLTVLAKNISYTQSIFVSNNVDLILNKSYLNTKTLDDFMVPHRYENRYNVWNYSTWKSISIANEDGTPAELPYRTLVKTVKDEKLKWPGFPMIDGTGSEEGYWVLASAYPQQFTLWLLSSRFNPNIEEIIFDPHAILCESLVNNLEKLKKIVLPKEAKEIPTYAFMNNATLNEVVFPEGCQINRIKTAAFSGCNALESITLPSALRAIENKAFSFMTKLSNLVLPEGLEEIEAESFIGATMLKKLTIPSTVTKIGINIIAQGGVEDLTLKCPSTTMIAEPFLSNPGDAAKIALHMNADWKNAEGKFKPEGNTWAGLTFKSIDFLP